MTALAAGLHIHAHTPERPVAGMVEQGLHQMGAPAVARCVGIPSLRRLEVVGEDVSPPPAQHVAAVHSLPGWLLELGLWVHGTPQQLPLIGLHMQRRAGTAEFLRHLGCACSGLLLLLHQVEEH